MHKWLIGLLSANRSSAGLRMNYALLDFPPMGLLGPDPWVLSELLWDPSQSVKQLEADFYDGAFGPRAAPLIRDYFDTISTSMRKATADLPFREINGVPAYIEPTYVPIRQRCRDLIDRAVAAVVTNDERYRWRVDRIARGWRLTELTLDALAASHSGSPERIRAAWLERSKFLQDRDNLFALAPASNDTMESELPLGPTANVQ